MTGKSLAIQYYHQGKLDESKELFNKLACDFPNDFQIWYFLSLIAYNKKDLNSAHDFIQRALRLKPEADFYNILGTVLLSKNMLDEGISAYKKAIELNPNCASYYSNLGAGLNRKNCPEKALEYYNKALKLDPNSAEICYNAAIAYNSLFEFDQSIELYKKALNIDPKYGSAYLNIATTLLLKQNFEEGWKYYQKRFWNLPYPKPKVSVEKPEWDGRHLGNKVLYIYHEQGLGDTIQFVRYLPVLNLLGIKTVFKPQQELESLLKICELKTDIINFSTPDDLVEFDYFIPLLNLPYILKTNAQNIPFNSRYLKADINKVIQYKHSYFNNNKFKVGIFWQGGTKHNKDKSTQLKNFYILSKFKNIQLYSLQKGFGSEQIGQMPSDFNIIDLGITFNDFSDTAAAIENLDLIIGIDTSVAHLAAALGKKTWILLQKPNEWRWFLDSDTSPWYNSVRLFRQKEKNNWEELMERVFNKLQSGV